MHLSPHHIPPDVDFMTAAGPEPGAVFLNTPCGPMLLRGNPLEALHFCLQDSSPAWRALDPREVRLSLRRLRELCARRRRPNRAVLAKDTTGSPDGAPSPRPEDLMAVHRLLGPRERQLCHFPTESAPWLLAWLADRDRSFEELLCSAPMLAVMVALDSAAQNAISPDELRVAIAEESALPRRDIVASHGLPGDVTSALGRITPAGASRSLLAGLRETLQDRDTRKLFWHLPCIGPDLSQIMSDHRVLKRVTGRFLIDLARGAKRKRRPVVAPLLEKAVLYGDHGFIPRRTYSSVSKLRETVEQVTSAVTAAEARDLLHRRFPRAPIADEPGLIEQIVCGEELLRESIEQRHCAAGREYVERLMRNEAWMFRVHRRFGMQRATALLEIVGRTEDEEPVYDLTETECRAGRPPARSTLGALRVWLENADIVAAQPQLDVTAKQLDLFRFGMAFLALVLVVGPALSSSAS